MKLRLLLALTATLSLTALLLFEGGGAPLGPAGVAEEGGDGSSGALSPDTEGQQQLESDEELSGRDPQEDAARTAAESGQASAATAPGIAGRVVLPQGSPPDLELRVYALVGERHHTRWGTELLYERPPGLVAEVEVAADGGFRLEPDVLVTETGAPRVEPLHLMATGRYLYTERSVEALPGDEGVLLTLEVGACLVAELTSAGEAPLELTLQQSLDDFSPGALINRVALRWTASTPGVQTVLFRALPHGSDYHLLVVPTTLGPTRRHITQLEPGEDSIVPIELSRGGVVAGAVTTSGGEPVQGATIEVLLRGHFFGFDDLAVRETESDADGKFVLENAPSGPVLVRSRGGGYLDSARASVTVPEGGRHDGVQLVVGEGQQIKGRVAHTDGTPAAGVTVDASFDMTHMAGPGAMGYLRGASGSSTTKEDGEFVITGLGPGPFAVTCTLAQAGEEQPPLKARADAVRPGSGELELILRAPMGLTVRVVDTDGGAVPGVGVVAYRLVDGALGPTASQVVRARSGEEGGAFLEALEAGSWELDVEGSSHVALSPVAFELPRTDSEPLRITVQPAATVRGVVLAATGLGTAGALVTIGDDDPSWMSNVSKGNELPQAKSAEDGVFELSGLPPGSLSILATAEGHAPSNAAEVELEAGEVLEDVTLTLTSGGSLIGLVYDEQGQLASGRFITANHLKTMNSTTASTDANGEFELRNLPPGSYQVIAMDGSADWSGEGEGMDMSAMMSSIQVTQADVLEGQVTEIVIGAPPEDPVKVHGRVTHGDEPWEGAIVTFVPPGEGPYQRMKFSTVDDDGRYTATIDGPGDYVVFVQKIFGGIGQQNTLEFDVEIPEVAEHREDFRIPLGRISGQVLDSDGEPAAGARVSLFPAGGASTQYLFGGHVVELQTGADGRYDIEGLRPGTYRLSAGGAQFWADGSELGRVTKGDIAVGADQWLKEVDFRLPAPGKIQVVIQDVDGNPVQGASVLVRDAGGSFIEPWSLTATDAGGRADYAGLAPGEYTLSARVGQLAAADSEPVKVPEGGTAKAELTVELGTVLWVKVLDRAAGEGVRARVTVTDAEGREVSGVFSLEDLQRLYSSAGFSTTEYRVGPLAPGKYEVLAETDGKRARKRVTLRGDPERKLTLRVR